MLSLQKTLQTNAITTAEITNGAVTLSKTRSGVSLGAGYYIANDGTVVEMQMVEIIFFV